MTFTWRRKLLWVISVLPVMLVAAYFILGSSAFFKSVILSRAGKALGGEVTAGEVAFSPFSNLRLRELKIKTTGTEPLVQAEEVRLRYSLFSILRGPLKIDEVTIVSPIVQIVENADGSFNLDPVLKNQTKSATQATAGNTPSKPPQIDLKNFTLTNATFRLIKNLTDGGQEVGELTGVNITLDQLNNGQPGKLTATSSFRMTRPTNDLLEATSTGKIEFVLGADLFPQSLKATGEMEVRRAEGSLRELAGVRAVFTGDTTPTEVKELSQQFLRGDQLLGEVKLSGPLDMSKKEGHLKLEVASIDRQVLNLFGAPLGLDFRDTAINSTTEVTLTQGGSVIAANTQFTAAKFSVTQNGQSTPPVDLRLACDLTINAATESATVQTFTLEGTQNQTPFLRGSLNKPMAFAWGKTAAATEDSTFGLVVTNFEIPEWKPFLGDAISAGRLSLQFNLLSEQGGKQIKFGVTSQVAGLAAKSLTDGALTLKLDGQTSDFKTFIITACRLDLTQQAQPALFISGSGSYDGVAFDLQSEIEVVLANLMGIGSGSPFSAGLKIRGSFANHALDLRQLQVTLAPTLRVPRNELQLAGHLDLATPGTIKGNLTANSETLDLTPLYDVFAGEKNSAPPQAVASTVPHSKLSGDSEPGPMQLPLQLNLEANLAQIYLREIAITNCHASAKLDGGKVHLDPCQLTLDGGPVNAKADFDLAVKGYAYALSLRMDSVSLEPIADSFSPDTRGQYQGLILANAQIKGAGVTGSSLQKTLGGQASLIITNGNLQLIGPKAKKLILPIARFLRLSEIAESPVNCVDAEAEMGGGNIKINGFTARSVAFQAQTQGVIPINDALTNSPLNLPVEFSLERALANQLGLLPPDTPTNATYATLPEFVAVRGTIGNPKSVINRKALGGIVLQSGAGMGKHLGVSIEQKTQSWIKGVGGFLRGHNQASTNQPETNAEPRFK